MSAVQKQIEQFAAAARETDDSLLTWSLSLSLRERLRACSNAARALSTFVDHVETEDGSG